MKSWTLRFRAVDKPRFDEIRSGVKAVETRAASIKYQPIRAGDELIFTCEKESLSKEVVKVHHFKSIDELFERIPLAQVMPDLDSLEQAKKRYESFPGYSEKINEFGLFAFELS